MIAMRVKTKRIVIYREPLSVIQAILNVTTQNAFLVDGFVIMKTIVVMVLMKSIVSLATVQSLNFDAMMDGAYVVAKFVMDSTIVKIEVMRRIVH